MTKRQLHVSREGVCVDGTKQTPHGKGRPGWQKNPTPNAMTDRECVCECCICWFEEFLVVVLARSHSYKNNNICDARPHHYISGEGGVWSEKLPRSSGFTHARIKRSVFVARQARVSVCL